MRGRLYTLSTLLVLTAVPALNACIIQSGDLRFNLSTLGVLHAEKDGFTYVASACADPLRGRPAGARCSPGALAYQLHLVGDPTLHQFGECIALSAAGQPPREAAALAGGAVGLELWLRGGDACGTHARAMRLSVECEAERGETVAGTLPAPPCAYSLRIRSPEGCPLQCARGAAGAVCGGAARGLCEAHGGGARCACAAGFTGAACELGVDAATEKLGLGALLIFAAATALAAAVALARARPAAGHPSARDANSSDGTVPAELVFPTLYRCKQSAIVLFVVSALLCGWLAASFGAGASPPVAAMRPPGTPTARAGDAAPLNGSSFPAPLPRFTWTQLPDDDGVARLRLLEDGRPFDSITHARVKRCLKNQHLVYMGDSVMRFQFTSLVHFLQSGRWFSARPQVTSEKQVGSWREYYRNTSKRLQGPQAHLICDCYRLNGVVCENWFYRDWSSSGSSLNVTFFKLFGAQPTYGHSLSFLNATCANGPCVQAGCEPGDCDSHATAGADWHWMLREGPQQALRFVADTLRPTTLLLNSGMWDCFDPLAEAVVAGGGALPNARLIWRTTTPYSTGANKCPDEPLLVERLRGAGWSVSNAFAAVKVLAEQANWEGLPPIEEVFEDHIHFTEPIYRAMNELFLDELCEGVA
jgi:hypothetical protein